MPDSSLVTDTGLDVAAWTRELQYDEDRDFLLHGITYGFDIIEPNSELKDTFVQNHKSALKPGTREVIEQIILDEIADGNYKVVDYKPTIVSAIGAVPKSGSEWRIIHDYSLPLHTGVNSFSPDFQHYSYESVDDAVSLMDKNHFAAKTDIRHAYRNVKINENSQRATGLCWTFNSGNTVYMVDRKLPFGARASPTIFHRLTQAVKRMMVRRGYCGLVVFQDDFLTVGSTYEECREAWECLKSLLIELGFQINAKKLVPPTQTVVFLGITIDSKACELSLPETKLVAIKSTVADFMRRKRATKRQLQQLVGRLCFASKVVRGARLFLRRLFNAIGTLRRPHHKFRLAGATMKDIQWWHSFLTDFNGVAAFQEETPITPVYTDACPVAGGAFCKGDIFYTVWDTDYPAIAESCINYKEAMVACLAVQRWGHLFVNKTVYLYTDNICAASVINKCSCKNEVLMQCMRDMFWVSVTYNFSVKAFYMPGYYQTLPDAISRMHESNGLLRVQTLIDNWYLCHRFVYNMFCRFSMLNHMSAMSLCYVLDQVINWRQTGAPSTGTFRPIDRRPSRTVPRQPIGVT